MNDIKVFDKPIRKPNNRGIRKVTEHFSSLKTGESNAWESQFERDYFYHLEIDKDVIEYRSQSVKISYQLNGKQRIFYPDVFENRKDEKSIAEVKPKSKLDKNKAKFSIVESICEDNGFVFKVVTEDQIYVDPKLPKIKLLYRYARDLMRMDQYSRIMDLFSRNGNRMFLKDALNELKSAKLGKSKIFHLIYHGFLSMDLMKPLDDDSEIWVTA